VGTLSLNNLSMRFELPNGDAVQALENVSLTLKGGELLSVLGPSGCGKTTLLNIVAGFLQPTAGELILNDHPIVGPDAERGMVFQQGALFGRSARGQETPRIRTATRGNPEHDLGHGRRDHGLGGGLGMTGLVVLGLYVAIFCVSALIVVKLVQSAGQAGFTSLKTVTFGDESAVRPNRVASVISIATILLLWGMFTGSSLLPRFMHAPGPFVGTISFDYTVEDGAGNTDDATVTVVVHPRDEKADKPDVAEGDGWAKNDTAVVAQLALPCGGGLSARCPGRDSPRLRDGFEQLVSGLV